MNDIPTQHPDRPLTRTESEAIELVVQQAALTAWRIHHDTRRNRRRLVRWALWCRLRAVVGVVTPSAVSVHLGRMGR